MAQQVKSAAGLPKSSGNGTQSYVANAGYGKHEGYGVSEALAPDQLTTTAPSTTPPSAASTSRSSTAPSTTTPPVSMPPTRSTTDAERTGDRHFPDTKDL